MIIRQRATMQLICDVTDKILYIHRYIYTDEIRGDYTIITPLLHAAKIYQLEGLVKKCLKRLEEMMDATTACSILKQACSLGETQMEVKRI